MQEYHRGIFLLDPRVEKLAKGLFKEYYSMVDADAISPKHIEKHEFAFGNFETKIAFRHLSFPNNKEFKRYLVENAPPFINCSLAEYERPSGRPMEAKGWLGSELIFDLDATDLHLKCQDEHGRSWTCDNCLSTVKAETIRLVEDFLIPDFGFSEREISINFSGNRGYHVHVSSPDVFKLNARARRNISEYITGTGIDPVAFFPTLGKRAKALKGPRPSDAGWGGKFAKGIVRALNSGEEALMALGIEKEIARRLVKNKTEIILGITLGNWDKVRIPGKAEFWKNVIKNMSIRQSDSIDKNVTNDPQHMIRLANTLHGDTGLVGKKLSSLNELQSFDPMKDAIVYRGKSLKVHVSRAPKLTMNGQEYGPYENVTVRLPIYVALYLMLKRVALPPGA